MGNQMQVTPYRDENDSARSGNATFARSSRVKGNLQP